MCRNVTFLCGQPGIYALGAVVAKLRNDPLRRDFYLSLFNKVSKLLPNRTLGISCTRWLQHNHRSPMHVGFNIDRVETTKHYIILPVVHMVQ